ncbi:ArsR/SmtB family transcription factor [Streptomyces iconiensis]|uniref:Winged helix-turn-helix domain-containing protein n=1 Tax=Streptomyces iconiensis TaxID=1384038 RepID=A0ABT6ZTA2_9ACTN|nr:winged helix-turn-helix domain-containing protein [Streptomyces iconiensis]MDJ1131861.1 winged helix-turn-helix domain-containing protein [Streptomyces iconiensis]
MDTERDAAPGLAAVAGLLADGTRAAFCLALLDGRAWTATELARHAGVAPSTATEHLNALVRGGLFSEVRQGRHRYVRLADSRIASLVENLASLAPERPAAPAPSLSASGRKRALAYARTCYDHLAGTVGVAVTDAMTGRRLLDWEQGLRLTRAGTDWLDGLGVTVASGTRRPSVRSCLDWTERRPHLAGAVGAALCSHALEAVWLVPVGTTRALTLTPLGQEALAENLGLSLNLEPSLRSS